MYPFKTYHPLVIFLYFLFVIGFSITLMHPVCLVISLFSGAMSIGVLVSWQALRKKLLFGLLLFLILTAINPLYSHLGDTILAHLPNGSPLTMESLLFGAAAALLLLSVFCHFYVYTQIMTNDKFLHLFGKCLPALSLVLSMSLGLFPRLVQKAREITRAQSAMGRACRQDVKSRAKAGLTTISILTSWALEDAAETADSMRARGYGLPKRTSFSHFHFTRRDAVALFLLLALGVYVAVGVFRGHLSFAYFPHLPHLSASLYTQSLFLAYLMLFLLPILIDVQEEIKWNVLKSKR